MVKISAERSKIGDAQLGTHQAHQAGYLWGSLEWIAGISLSCLCLFEKQTKTTTYVCVYIYIYIYIYISMYILIDT
jgi:hypothetical protein